MMKNLQIEWMKIRSYRVFQVFSVLYMLGILLIIYIFYKIYMSIIASLQQSVTGVKSEGMDALNLFITDSLPATVCFWTSFLLYLPGMVIINLFINEVNFKTHRQNIIDGWKRETFIYTKINLILCIAAATTVMNFIAIMIMAQITNASLSVGILKVLGFSFVQSFIYLMFALLLATFFRRSGIAIIIFFIYGLLLEPLFMWIFGKIIPGMQHFLPLQVSDSLIPFPPMKEFYLDLPSEMVMLVASLAFAGLYVYLAVRKYKYDDL